MNPQLCDQKDQAYRVSGGRVYRSKRLFVGVLKFKEPRLNVQAWIDLYGALLHTTVWRWDVQVYLAFRL